MKDFQQRVVTEKADLDKKHEKLGAFFSTPEFLGLPVEEQERMERQHGIMGHYSQVLGERIKAFV